MSEEDDKARDYRQMIIKLKELIKDDELGNMLFYCKSYIKASQRDEIKDFLALIIALEERKKVSYNKLDFLKELLKFGTSGRKDVFDPVLDYENEGPVAMDATPEYPQRDYSNPELNETVEFLKRKLGRDWRFFARSLKVSDEDIDNLADEYPRNVKEQIYRAIKLYINREREGSSKQDLIAACRQIRRNDLATKLEREDYT